MACLQVLHGVAQAESKLTANVWAKGSSRCLSSTKPGTPATVSRPNPSGPYACTGRTEWVFGREYLKRSGRIGIPAQSAVRERSGFRVCPARLLHS